MTRPPIGSIIRFEDGREGMVTGHTVRGFRYRGTLISRKGSYFTGEGEIYTDTPEWADRSKRLTIMSPEPVSLNIPLDDIKRIESLLGQILEPRVAFSEDPLKIAHAVIASDQDLARQIAQILRPYLS